VEVSDDQVAALRAYLSAINDVEADAAEAQFLALAKSNRHQEIGVLVYCSFAAAARRRFSGGWTSADLVRFVADVRGGSTQAAALVSASAAENQLRTVLGSPPARRPDEETRARVQLLLLSALTADMADEELETVLSEARVLADQLSPA
jgi:hypothetical protein